MILPDSKYTQSRFQQIAGKIARIGAWIIDTDSERVFWSEEICDLHELAHGTSLSVADAGNYFAAEDRHKMTDLLSECMRAGTPFDTKAEIVTASGARVAVRVIGIAVREEAREMANDAVPAISHIQGIYQRNPDRSASLSEARMAQRLTTTMESITDAIVMVDHEWNFTYLNHEAERLLSCPRDEVLGTNIWARFPEAVGGRYYQEYHKAVETNKAVFFEEYYGPLNLWTEVRAYPSEEGLAIYFVDIGSRKAAENEIHELAFFDKLTALPNRQLFLNRLEHAMVNCRRSRLSGAVICIDLDNFKSINDTRGHDKGDILLKQVAKRIIDNVREGDTVARIGGDEFVILLEELGTCEEEVSIKSKRVARALLDSFKEPFEIAGMQQFSTCSVGIAIFDPQALSVDDMLQRADVAMYQAKAAGRNTLSFFSQDMQARISDRVALEADLRIALKERQFLLHYQPQTDFDGNMTGVEALVRWSNPARGLISPADFIPVAEQTGLILSLGHWVLGTACSLLAKWGECARTECLTMAVNVSASQLHHPDFVDQVLLVLAATGANAKRLKLELTESMLVTDIDGTIEKMNRLKEAGVLFSLDDFGTGYSSLAYLRRLPLAQLKIDQSFVRDALTHQHGEVIVRTILALGKALDLLVIAEGVETPEQRDFIRQEGCQEYQGYLYSRPLPLQELIQFIDNAHILTNTGSRIESHD
jgi:diguanylate cyclase (GGDEF)-like protein/PAS domain S-box-containing protein